MLYGRMAKYSPVIVVLCYIKKLYFGEAIATRSM